MADSFVIKFYTPVTEASIGTLMRTVDQKLAAGATHFTVLISTSGGSVFHGLTAYNYLKGIPAQVTTHNIPGVGTVTIEVFEGALYLSGVSAPGWEVERDKIEPDRIELEFTSGEAEAEFEARLRAGGVDVKIEVDSD